MRKAIGLAIVAGLLLGILVFPYENVVLGQSSDSPSAQTNAVDSVDITPTATVLRGYAIPTNLTGTAWFEYGTDPASFGFTSGNTTIYPISYYQANPNSYSFFRIPVTGLTQGTTYYYRAVVRNSQGIAFGQPLSFKTLAGYGMGLILPATSTGMTPTVTTKTNTNITGTSAVINGEANLNGGNGSVWFEYGLTQSLGDSTPQQSMGNSNSAVAYSYALTNLLPNARYYFRAVAQNQYGNTKAPLAEFTTRSGTGANTAIYTYTPTHAYTYTQPATRIVYTNRSEQTTFIQGEEGDYTIQLAPPTPEQLSQFAAQTNIAYARELPTAKAFATVSRTVGFSGSGVFTFILVVVLIFLAIWVLVSRRN